MTVSRKGLRRLANTVMTRAIFFTCTYETAWNQWVTEDDKRGYSFDVVERKILNK